MDFLQVELEQITIYCSGSSSSTLNDMTNAHETQCKVKTLKTDTEEINQWKKIKTQSINIHEQHSKYKVLFHNSS